MKHWNVRVSQRTDMNDRPSANPSGGLLTITLESTGNVDFFDWAISPDMTKSGRVVFDQSDGQGSIKTFNFVDAYCTDYYEEYNSDDNSPMVFSIVISALELSIGTSRFQKNWNKTSVR